MKSPTSRNILWGSEVQSVIVVVGCCAKNGVSYGCCGNVTVVLVVAVVMVLSAVVVVVFLEVVVVV
jgi:hypothetical protein